MTFPSEKDQPAPSTPSTAPSTSTSATGPTITVVEMQDGTLWATLAAYDGTPEGMVELLDFHSSWQEAYDYASDAVYLAAASQPLPRSLKRLLPNRSYRYGSDSTRPEQVKVRLSDKAWGSLQAATNRLGYAGHSATTGSTHYLLALLRANPAPTDWTDTRPNQLKVFDAPRLAKQQWPFWSDLHVMRGFEYAPELKRRPRFMNQAQVLAMTPALLSLANAFLISPPVQGTIDPSLRAYAVLEAIGLGYLTPSNPAPDNPHPVNAARTERERRRRRNQGHDLAF